MKISLSIQDSFLLKVDEHAKNENRTRSELIREAVRFYINRKQLLNNHKAECEANILEKIL